MPDIFGRVDQVFGGGLSSDTMFMTFPALAAGGLGLLVQSVQLQYTQPVRRINELGPGVFPGGGTAAGCDVLSPSFGAPACASRAQRTYYIIGRPEGSMQMARIFGPSLIGITFYRTYGNPCGINSLQLSARAGCNGLQAPVSQTWEMNGVIITSMSAQATAQEMIVQESIQLMFVGLNISATDGNGAVVAAEPAAAAPPALPPCTINDIAAINEAIDNDVITADEAVAFAAEMRHCLLS